jgi:hypothetical protein
LSNNEKTASGLKSPIAAKRYPITKKLLVKIFNSGIIHADYAAADTTIIAYFRQQ